MIKSDGYNASLYLKVATLIWVIVILVLCIIVFIAPLKHTVTPVYHEAVQRWMAGEPLYINPTNLYSASLYFYFPQFVFIFMPFHLLPNPFGDILWRIVQTGLLSWAIWRIISLSRTRQNERLFLYASVFSIIQSLGALRNGQANVFFAALTVHAAACLARSQWGLAALCLIVALTVKPLGLVMILLAVVVYRPTIGRLAVGISVFLITPFLFGKSSYVLSQYQQALEHLASFSVITENRFADVNGLLRALGIGLTGIASQIIRMAAGLLTLVFWWIGAKRTHEPERAWLLLALTTTYLMLFNPMTEGNSYVIVAPILAVYAIHFLQIDIHPKLGWGLVFMGFSIGVLPEILRRVDRNFSLWWSPLMMLLFSAILVYTTLSRQGLRQPAEQ